MGVRITLNHRKRYFLIPVVVVVASDLAKVEARVQFPHGDLLSPISVVA